MVGIIILNYNSTDDTIKCVASVEEFTKIAYQIYIVDGASKDNSYNRLVKYFASNNKITVIKSDINGGYSYGNNLGVKQAIKDGSETLLIINPDVILLNSAVDILYDELYKQNDVAIVGPRIFDLNNIDRQFAAKPLTFLNFCLSKKPIIYLWRKKFRDLRYYKISTFTNFKFSGSVSGCCFMIKASDFIKIDLFDENIFLYHEEDVLAYKLIKLGKLTMINTNAKVLHNHSSTVNKEGEAFLRYHRSISGMYVLNKYAEITRFQSIFASMLIILPFQFLTLFKKPYRVFSRSLIKKTLKISYNSKNNL